MPGQTLTKKPLIEAICELRWGPVQAIPGTATDPNYKLLVGRFYDRIEKEYPIHEPLPAASVPDEMLSHVVQHRFRKSPQGWPCAQIGPGILTYNETADYDWVPFRDGAAWVVTKLFEAYPSPTKPVIGSLTLR
jgi:uncharacterized protein (TIGR04255 family)